MNTNKHLSIGVTGVALALALSMTLPAFAETATEGTGSTTKKEATQTARIAKIHDRAAEEIDRRIAALNLLATRVNAMKHVSDDKKSAIASTVSSQISMLTELKVKIAGENDLTALKTHVQSITQSYRIFMLVIPQGHIVATADRAIQIADSMAAVGAKLTTRITEASANGADVHTLSAALDDFNAQLGKAKIAAQAAIDGVAGLTPDNGDKVKMEANKKALTDARAKVKDANVALKAARADAKTIVSGLKGMKKTEGSGAGSTTTAQ